MLAVRVYVAKSCKVMKAKWSDESDEDGVNSKALVLIQGPIEHRAPETAHTISTFPLR